MGMRARGALATIACGGAFALLPAQAALAAPVATTLQATSVTITSAQLTGTVDASSSDTAWGFQYGTTTPYGLDRGPHPIGSGFTFVEQSVTGPTPGTSYHYRLSVIQGAGYTPAVSLGGDVAFTTLSSSSGQTPHSKLPRPHCSGGASMSSMASPRSGSRAQARRVRNAAERSR